MIEYTLKDLVKIKNGRDHQHLADGDIPLLGSGGIMRYVDQKLFDQESVLLPRKGSLSNIQYINEPFWTVDTLYYTEVDKTKVEPYYLYNYLKLLDLSGLNSGTGVPSMTFGAYYGIKLNLPDLKTQKQIAKVLSDLDAKIEVNNQINQQLEAMAKKLYDYWFVQFDFPDENGKPYKSAGGTMVYNEELKREIPDGWEVSTIKEKLVVSLGGTPSTKVKEYWDHGDYHWLNSGEIANFPIVDSELKITEEAIKNSATDLLPKGTIAMSITRHIRPSILGIDACANQSVIGILENENIKSSFIYPMIKNEVPRYMSLRTGAQQPHINKTTVDTTFFVLPPQEILEEYYGKVDSIYNKIIVNAIENQKLTELRDWLLPMLMNGQIKIKSKIKSKSNATSSESREVVSDVDNSNFNNAGDVDGGLGRVAESGVEYGKAQTLNDIFDSINYDNEVGAVIFLTRKTLGRNYGKKYIHKMFSNIQFLSELPVFEDLVFEENGWGMHCSILKKTIENEKYFKTEGIDLNRNVLSFDYSQTKEIARWMDKDDESRRFVANVENMLTIYQKPLINKSMYRIELFNTVLECMRVLKTDDYNKIRAKMKTWKMFESENKSKADKFKPEETRAMISFVKNFNMMLD